MSIASKLRQRLDALEALKKNPEATRGQLAWDERALSFLALDALPTFLEIVEALNSDGRTGNPFVEIHAMTRVWEKVHQLTKEADVDDTAANCG